MFNMFPIKSCYMGILLLATCCLMLAQCALEPSLANDDQFADNLIDGKTDDGDDALNINKRPSFFVGSRYGRSGIGVGGSSLFGSSKTRRLNVVPRNDRFFLGSRYGKRADEYISAYEQNNGGGAIDTASASLVGNHQSNNNNNNNNHINRLSNDSTSSNMNNNKAPFMMSCVYVYKNYYRCNSIEEINNIINQLTTGQTDDAK